MKMLRGIATLVAGFLFVIAVLLFVTGTLDPPPGTTVGPTNYIFGGVLAAGCFLVAYWDISQALRHSKALRSELLKDAAVIDFYERTMKAWSAGELDEINASYQREGSMTYDRFVDTYPPIEGGALSVLFRQFPPRQDEYLVAAGDAGSGNGWFVLTNQRLVQKDGRDNAYRDLDLSAVSGYETSGTMTKKLVFRMSSGTTVEFEKVDIFPVEKVFMAVVERARGG